MARFIWPDRLPKSGDSGEPSHDTWPDSCPLPPRIALALPSRSSSAPLSAKASLKSITARRLAEAPLAAAQWPLPVS